MKASLGKSILEKFRAMSQREQLLALGVAVLVAAFVVMRIARGALGYIGDLDAQIDSLSSAIVNDSYQITRKESVNAQYSEVAAQHSSKWTEAEIHDRLRQEIYRLAQAAPPALDANGIPVTTAADAQKLVEIPAVGEGTLTTTDDGFREYKLAFTVPRAKLPDLVSFIDRLQGSPQSLRIDGLDIHRDPLGTDVSAEIAITRIVAREAEPEEEKTETAKAGAPAGGAERPKSAKVEEIKADPTLWGCDGCEAKLNPAAGKSQPGAVSARSVKGGSALYLQRALPAGATYELCFVMQAEGKGRLAVGFANGTDVFKGESEIEAGTTKRYRLQFTVPGAAGSTTRIRAPFVRLEDPGAAVSIGSVTLERIA